MDTEIGTPAVRHNSTELPQPKSQLNGVARAGHRVASHLPFVVMTSTGMARLHGGPSTRQPEFRIACCLCGRPIVKSATHHGLDQEWKRRFPGLPGSLAHERCAVYKFQWNCQDAGRYPVGHQAPDRRPDRICYDAWDHLNGEGTQKAMTTLMPWSGLLQGAEQYLRHVAGWHVTNSATRQELQGVLERWDAPGGREYALANSHSWSPRRPPS